MLKLKGRLLAFREPRLEDHKFNISLSTRRVQRREKRISFSKLPIQWFKMEVSGAQARFTNSDRKGLRN